MCLTFLCIFQFIEFTTICNVYYFRWLLHLGHSLTSDIMLILSLSLSNSLFSLSLISMYRYGFKRITSGEDRNAYYHELFLRGKPFLGYKIKRLRVKGTGVRMASSPETEPNVSGLRRECSGCKEVIHSFPYYLTQSFPIQISYL